MQIVNIRVDDRLIHGQVATIWSMVTKATRIIVIDDNVVKDVVNKEALKMACPQQCKLSILTVKRAAENLIAKKYEGEKVFIVVKSPKTLRELYDLGVLMEKINVGNMGGGQNKVLVKKAVSVSKENIEDFLYLANKGIKLSAQMVPADEEVNLTDLLMKI